MNSGECDCGIRSSQHAGTCDPMHNTGTCSSFRYKHAHTKHTHTKHTHTKHTHTHTKHTLTHTQTYFIMAPLSFHHNIVLVSSGDVLCATTDHAMNNMTLNENVYFATDHKQMQFPNKLVRSTLSHTRTRNIEYHSKWCCRAGRNGKRNTTRNR